jgi:hypothetical protein
MKSVIEELLEGEAAYEGYKRFSELPKLSGNESFL